MNRHGPAFLSVHAVADELGISVSSVRRHVDSGELASTRLGARILIPRTELERLADDALEGGDAA